MAQEQSEKLFELEHPIADKIEALVMQGIRGELEPPGKDALDANGVVAGACESLAMGILTLVKEKAIDQAVVEAKAVERAGIDLFVKKYIAAIKEAKTDNQLTEIIDAIYEDGLYGASQDEAIDQAAEANSEVSRLQEKLRFIDQRATRHLRGTNEQKYLIMDLEYISDKARLRDQESE